MTPVPIGLGRIFLAFTRIGLTSFGGGISGWMLQDFVRERRWIDEAAFLNGLALAQAFPGTNVVNLAIWIGYRLAGGAGAAVAVFGLIGPSLLAALVILAAFDLFRDARAAHLALDGIGAAAIGLSLQMALRTLRRAARSLFPTALAAAVFLAVFALKLPLPLVVLVAAPIGVGRALWRSRQAA